LILFIIIILLDAFLISRTTYVGQYNPCFDDEIDKVTEDLRKSIVHMQPTAKLSANNSSNRLRESAPTQFLTSSSSNTSDPSGALRRLNVSYERVRLWLPRAIVTSCFMVCDWMIG
jgi:hypothetical protein